MPTEPKHTKIKRYATPKDFEGYGPVLLQSETGEFVRYADIERALNLLNRLDEMGVSAKEVEQMAKDRLEMIEKAKDVQGCRDRLTKKG